MDIKNLVKVVDSVDKDVVRELYIMATNDRETVARVESIAKAIIKKKPEVRSKDTLRKSSVIQDVFRLACKAEGISPKSIDTETRRAVIDELVDWVFELVEIGFA